MSGNPAITVRIFRCGCCLETFAVPSNEQPAIDKDLGAAVCPSCRRALLWAHARLKDERITPCLPMAHPLASH